MTALAPIIKWPGGKETELPYIKKYMPVSFGNFYEPFVGGGSVFMAMEAEHYFINDKSEELVSLYRAIGGQDRGFLLNIISISRSWKKLLRFVKANRRYKDLYIEYRAGNNTKAQLRETIAEYLGEDRDTLQACIPGGFTWHRDRFDRELMANLSRKMQRMKVLEDEKGVLPDADVYDNVEAAFMSALYMYYRTLYNDRTIAEDDAGLGTALFTFMRNYAYSGMFRYNDRGEFNVPYGGIAYNHKLMDKKTTYYRSAPVKYKFGKTRIYCADFEEFLRETAPGENDFVFLDPPYDSDFSTYAKNTFGKDDQKRLADYLVDECKAKWMMIIKNTPYIMSLYGNRGLNIGAFDKKYLVSFMNRNDKNVEHLIISNYSRCE